MCPAYFIPELAHVVAMCDEKLPFVALAEEFSKRNIPHSGLQVEANSTSLVLKLLSLPPPEIKKQQQPGVADAKVIQVLFAKLSNFSILQFLHFENLSFTQSGSLPIIDKHVWNALMKKLLSVSLRSQIRNNHARFWTVEMVFYGSPVPSAHNREQGLRRPLYFQYELGPTALMGRTVDNLLRDWSKVVYLYYLVHDFAEQYKNGKF